MCKDPDLSHMHLRIAVTAGANGAVAEYKETDLEKTSKARQRLDDAQKLDQEVPTCSELL